MARVEQRLAPVEEPYRSQDGAAGLVPYLEPVSPPGVEADLLRDRCEDAVLKARGDRLDAVVDRAPHQVPRQRRAVGRRVELKLEEPLARASRLGIDISSSRGGLDGLCGGPLLRRPSLIDGLPSRCLPGRSIP